MGMKMWNGSGGGGGARPGGGGDALSRSLYY